MLEWIISASVLIILVIISRKLLRGRISRRVQYSLWLLVAVRLLVPVSPLESAFSVANLLPENRAEQGTGQVLGKDGEARGAGTALDLTMPAMAVSGIRHPEDGRALLPESISSAAKRDDPLSEDNVADIAAKPKAGVMLGVTWLSGSCLLALWLLGVNESFRRKVCRNRLPFREPEELNRYIRADSEPESAGVERHGTQLSGCGAADGGRKRIRVKTRKQLPVYVTDEIGTPCMYGLLRPAVYITSRTAEDSRVLAMVLCHEQTHYRHGDHIWSAVRMLCLCLHWYNPLVWAAAGLSRRDGEMACDEGVLRQLGEKNRKRYGEALLALSTEYKPTLRSSLHLATSMSDTRKQLKERLSALMAIPRMAAGTAALVFLLALGLAVCTFTGRADAREEEGPAGRTGILKYSPQDSEEAEDAEDAAIGSDGQETGTDLFENVSLESLGDSEPEEAAAVYDSWDAQIKDDYNEEGNPVAEVTEGDLTRKLTFVETSWSVSAKEALFSREVLYWACQALLELEQWTGTQVTEACYTVSEFGDFYFALTPGDMRHSRTFYSRCYSGLSFVRGEVIESISYSTDMDVWYSPVRQYTTPPKYDRMTAGERLVWFFERSAIARGSKVEEIIYPWEGNDYLFRTDQGTYYDFADTEGVDTLGKGLYLTGPYDGYPQH